MKNAFFVLGAMPEDSSEKLKELFEEKQLFCDDDKDLEFAYLELINVKKRIKHEIGYFTSKTFKNFDKIFFDDTSDEQEIVIEDMCKAIIKVGKWFDLGIDDLFVKINNSREIAKFTQISDKDSLQDSISELRSEYILAVKKYFDYFKEKDIVLIFNNLVKEPNYMSFFVDDLLSIYESALQVSIENKEKTCLRKFKLVENGTNYFLDFDQIPSDFSDNINDFKKSLVIWDSYVQPLQVNSKNRGVQHEGSIKFASLLRNKVIDMCNESQESLQKLIKNPWGYGSLAKQTLVNKIVKSIEFTNYLIKILNILQSTFAEMVVFNERLQKDKEDFENLKEVLETVLTQLDPYKAFSRAVDNVKEDKIETSSKNNTKSESKNQSANDDAWSDAIRAVMAITIMISFVIMVIGFGILSNVLGVLSLIIGVISSLCAYKWGQSRIKLNTMKFVSIFFAIIVFIICCIAISISNKESFESRRYNLSNGTELTSSNFSTYFNINSNCSINSYSRIVKYTYSIYPKSSFHYSLNSNNPSSISITIGLNISSYYSSYEAPSEYKIYLILYKSNGYKTSSSKTYTISYSEKYWKDGVYSVFGTIYN